MQALVSIIVPIYSVQMYLNDCIKSITEQTYTNLEIILVDDGSPDDCPQICESWGRTDDRIRVIHKKNGGLSDARNVGIDNSHGDYIAFLDGDDFVSQQWIEKMVSAAESYKADIVICGRYIYQNGLCNVKHCLNVPKFYSSQEALKELLMGREIEEAAWDKLYKRELFAIQRFPVGEINEDIVTIPYIIAKAQCIYHIGEPLYYYRQTSTGITKTRYTKKKSIYIQHILKIRDYIMEYYPQFITEIGCFMGRYSYALLLGLALNKEDCKAYAEDYACYLRFLRRNTKYLLKTDIMTNVDKLKIILLDFNLFPALIRLKKKIVR